MYKNDLQDEMRINLGAPKDSVDSYYGLSLIHI